MLEQSGIRIPRYPGSVREIWASGREFGARIVRHVYALAVGVVGGILGVVNALAAATAKRGTTPFSVPVWVWASLLSAGFAVAIFGSFHDVRRERDAAKNEMASRFDALRYALSFSGIGSHVHPRGDAATSDVQISFELTNNSAEFLRYEFEDATVVIEGRQSADDDPALVNGGILAPHESARQISAPVCGVPLAWQSGTLTFTVRYGHPSAPFRYRKTQERRLSMRRLAGHAPGEGQVWAELVSDPAVEDVL